MNRYGCVLVDVAKSIRLFYKCVYESTDLYLLARHFLVISQYYVTR